VYLPRDMIYQEICKFHLESCRLYFNQ